jgi:hypothetical protein
MSESEVQALKQEIKKGIDKASVKTLRMLHQILEIENEEDWWDNLPEAVQQSIDQGLKQSGKRQGISHEEFMKRNAKWLKK